MAEAPEEAHDILLRSDLAAKMPAATCERLLAAIKAGDESTVRALCTEFKLSGAGISQRSHQTLLHFASKSGNAAVPVARVLIEKFQFDPRIQAEGKGTCLHLAAESGACEMMQYLLSLPGADLNECVISYSGDRPIDRAAARFDLPMLQLLQKAGAAVDQANQVQMLPLQYAVEAAAHTPEKQKEKKAVIMALLPHTTLTPVLFRAFLKLNDAALLFEAVQGRSQATILECLQCKVAGTTPLLECAYSGRANVVLPLILIGGWNPEDKRLGKNAWEVAESMGYSAMAQMMKAAIAAMAR
jgi:hypothetical protein